VEAGVVKASSDGSEMDD